MEKATEDKIYRQHNVIHPSPQKVNKTKDREFPVAQTNSSPSPHPDNVVLRNPSARSFGGIAGPLNLSSNVVLVNLTQTKSEVVVSAVLLQYVLNLPYTTVNVAG